MSYETNEKKRASVCISESVCITESICISEKADRKTGWQFVCLVDE